MAKNITIEPLKETTLRVELIGAQTSFFTREAVTMNRLNASSSPRTRASKCQLFTISQRMFGRA